MRSICSEGGSLEFEPLPQRLSSDQVEPEKEREKRVRASHGSVTIACTTKEFYTLFGFGLKVLKGCRHLKSDGDLLEVWRASHRDHKESF